MALWGDVVALWGDVVYICKYFEAKIEVTVHNGYVPVHCRKRLSHFFRVFVYKSSCNVGKEMKYEYSGDSEILHGLVHDTKRITIVGHS